MVDHLTDVYRPLLCLCQRLKSLDVPWLVGGSTGCLLQKVRLEREPNDLDIYTDHIYLDHFQQTLEDWSLEDAHYSETEQYRSYLSRYQNHSLEAELVANLSVCTEDGQYDVDVCGLLAPFAPTVDILTESVQLMPLEHELVFNLLRNREDRYAPIATAIKHRGVHRSLWQQLQERNTLSEEFWNRASALIGLFE